MIWCDTQSHEPPTVVPLPARPPTTTADLISNSNNEYQGICPGSDDEDAIWLDDGDVMDHVDLVGAERNEFDADHPIQPMATRRGDRYVDSKGGG